MKLIGLPCNHLKKELRNSLPEYMIPYTILQYDKFPLTNNGKIDKKALMSDYVSHYNNPDVQENKADNMLTKTEKLIFDIWSAALHTKNFDINDNFFDIGGDSILAVTVFSKIEEAFNLKMNLRVFFDKPVIKDLAETMEIRLNSNAKEQKPPLQNTGNIINGEL